MNKTDPVLVCFAKRNLAIGNWQLEILEVTTLPDHISSRDEVLSRNVAVIGPNRLQDAVADRLLS